MAPAGPMAIPFRPENSRVAAVSVVPHAGGVAGLAGWLVSRGRPAVPSCRVRYRDTRGMALDGKYVAFGIRTWLPSGHVLAAT